MYVYIYIYIYIYMYIAAEGAEAAEAAEPQLQQEAPGRRASMQNMRC